MVCAARMAERPNNNRHRQHDRRERLHARGDELERRAGQQHDTARRREPERIRAVEERCVAPGAVEARRGLRHFAERPSVREQKQKRVCAARERLSGHAETRREAPTSARAAQPRAWRTRGESSSENLLIGTCAANRRREAKLDAASLAAEERRNDYCRPRSEHHPLSRASAPRKRKPPELLASDGKKSRKSCCSRAPQRRVLAPHAIDPVTRLSRIRYRLDSTVPGNPLGSLDLSG